MIKGKEKKPGFWWRRTCVNLSGSLVEEPQDSHFAPYLNPAHPLISFLFLSYSSFFFSYICLLIRPFVHRILSLSLSSASIAHLSSLFSKKFIQCGTATSCPLLAVFPYLLEKNNKHALRLPRHYITHRFYIRALPLVPITTRRLMKST